MNAVAELEGFQGPVKVSRLEHSLQSATRAHRAGKDKEYVAAALLHDIGDALAPYSHGDMVAGVLRPFVSERICWIRPKKAQRCFRATALPILMCRHCTAATDASTVAVTIDLRPVLRRTASTSASCLDPDFIDPLPLQRPADRAGGSSPAPTAPWTILRPAPRRRRTVATHPQPASGLDAAAGRSRLVPRARADRPRQHADERDRAIRKPATDSLSRGNVVGVLVRTTWRPQRGRASG